MLNLTFDYNGYTFKRVNKTIAKRAYINGLSIVICPCNLHPFSAWMPGVKLNKKSREAFVADLTGLKNDFENWLDSFMYYNCDAERGYYPAYYIPVTTEDGIEHYNYKYMEV